MKRRVCLALALGCCVLFGAIGSAVEPVEQALSREIEVSPARLESPGPVEVRIAIANVQEEAISVTLYDPEGNICTAFGSGGTAQLEAGAAASYHGAWLVSQRQLDVGRIAYSARYAQEDDAGESIAATLPIAASIEGSVPGARLQVERTVEPGMTCAAGDTVTIRYLVKNIGDTDIHALTFADPEILAAPVVTDSIAPGEEAEVVYAYAASQTPRTTHAEITYQYDLAGRRETSGPIMADPPIRIEVTR